MENRVVPVRGFRRGLLVAAFILSVALLAGPSQADIGVNFLSVDDVTVVEGDLGIQSAVFTVSLTPADPDDTVTVDYTTSDGTATGGSDFTPVLLPTQITFDPGEVQKTIAVDVLGDLIDEADETFSVELANEVNASIDDGVGTGTIDDDDGPTISIDNLSVDEDAGPATFTVSLSATSPQPVSVQYSTASGTAGASDYTSQSGTATIPAGAPSATIDVPIVNDSLDEPNETFVVNLSSPTNGTIADSQGQATITDDDPAPTISIANATAVTEGANASFTVSLSAASGKTVTVGYSTANGSAIAPGDYDADSGTVTFNPGVTSQPIAISTNDDAIDESNGETFTVSLSGPSNATILDASGAGTINDNDSPPMLSIGNATVAEGGSAAFTVSLSAASDQTVTVDYSKTNGTTVNADFSGSTSGTVTFDPGDTSEPISIGTTEDALNEANETFTVTLANPSNATILDVSGSGTINDDDPTPALSISDAPAVVEGGTASFSVSLSAASGQNVTVQLLDGERHRHGARRLHLSQRRGAHVPSRRDRQADRDLDQSRRARRGRLGDLHGHALRRGQRDDR